MVTDHFKVTSDERGFTITKSLAWTMIAGLIGSAFWFGAEMNGLKTGLDSLQRGRDSFRIEVQNEMTSMDRRLRVVERSGAQLSEAVRGQTALLERIDRRFEALDQRLRSQERDGVRP